MELYCPASVALTTKSPSLIENIQHTRKSCVEQLRLIRNLKGFLRFLLPYVLYSILYCIHSISCGNQSIHQYIVYGNFHIVHI